MMGIYISRLPVRIELMSGNNSSSVRPSLSLQDGNNFSSYLLVHNSRY